MTQLMLRLSSQTAKIAEITETIAAHVSWDKSHSTSTGYEELFHNENEQHIPAHGNTVNCNNLHLHTLTLLLCQLSFYRCGSRVLKTGNAQSHTHQPCRERRSSRGSCFATVSLLSSPCLHGEKAASWVVYSDCCTNDSCVLIKTPLMSECKSPSRSSSSLVLWLRYCKRSSDRNYPRQMGIKTQICSGGKQSNKMIKNTICTIKSSPSISKSSFSTILGRRGTESRNPICQEN